MQRLLWDYGRISTVLCHKHSHQSFCSDSLLSSLQSFLCPDRVVTEWKFEGFRLDRIKSPPETGLRLEATSET